MTVSIIIVTWDPKNKKYLDLCIESIRRLDFPKEEFEVILVARNGYLPQYEGVKTCAPEEDHFYPARAVNYGYFIAEHSKPKYYFVLNDDVILTRDSLKHLVEGVGDNNIMANAVSPCDNIWSNYFLGIKFGDRFVPSDVRSFAYEDMDLYGGVKGIMHSSSLYGPGWIKQPFLCIYATLIPRMLREAVGDWDEGFKTGQDDLDYSLRAQRAGFLTVSILNALVWHFSGVTVTGTLNLKIRQDNVRYFRDKWGFMPPGIDESFLTQSQGLGV